MSDGDVCSSLWIGDMGSLSTRPQKIACLPDEVSARHYWSDLVEQEKK